MFVVSQRCATVRRGDETVLRTCSRSPLRRPRHRRSRARDQPTAAMRNDVEVESAVSGIMVNNSAAFCCGVTDKLGWSNARTYRHAHTWACDHVVGQPGERPVARGESAVDEQQCPSVDAVPTVVGGLPAPAVRVSPGADMHADDTGARSSYLAAGPEPADPHPSPGPGRPAPTAVCARSAPPDHGCRRRPRSGRATSGDTELRRWAVPFSVPATSTCSRTCRDSGRVGTTAALGLRGSDLDAVHLASPCASVMPAFGRLFIMPARRLCGHAHGEATRRPRQLQSQLGCCCRRDLPLEPPSGCPVQLEVRVARQEGVGQRWPCPPRHVRSQHRICHCFSMRRGPRPVSADRSPSASSLATSSSTFHNGAGTRQPLLRNAPASPPYVDNTVLAVPWQALRNTRRRWIRPAGCPRPSTGQSPAPRQPNPGVLLLRQC